MEWKASGADVGVGLPGRWDVYIVHEGVQKRCTSTPGISKSRVWAPELYTIDPRKPDPCDAQPRNISTFMVRVVLKVDELIFSPNGLG